MRFYQSSSCSLKARSQYAVQAGAIQRTHNKSWWVSIGDYINSFKHHWEMYALLYPHSQLWFKKYYNCPFTKTALALNNPQSLICHLAKNPKRNWTSAVHGLTCWNTNHRMKVWDSSDQITVIKKYRGNSPELSYYGGVPVALWLKCWVTTS